MGKNVQLRKIKMEDWGANVYLGDDETIIGVFSQPWQPPGGSGGMGYGHYPQEVFIVVSTEVK